MAPKSDKTHWPEGGCGWLILDTGLKMRTEAGCRVGPLHYFSVYQVLPLGSSGHPQLMVVPLTPLKSDLKETGR